MALSINIYSLLKKGKVESNHVEPNKVWNQYLRII
jgi:hypothetical protein